jgi:predicted nucleic acid-binding protein
VKQATFLDTVHILALVNPADQWHARAVAWSAAISGSILTTGAVLVEVADALCRRDRRRRAAAIIEDLRKDPVVRCVPVDDPLLERGLAFYQSRGDKDWSLTDCISFVVMADGGIRDALTADEHFQQAGFRALLREPLPN